MTFMIGRFGSTCRTASRTDATIPSGSPAVRTSNVAVPWKTCAYGVYLVGTAGSRTALYLASRRTPTISSRPLLSGEGPTRRPIGDSLRNNLRAAASLITATRGAPALSSGVKPRPSTSGISIVSKNVGDTPRPDVVSRWPGGYARPWTYMLPENRRPDISELFDHDTARTPEIVRRRSPICS